MRESLENRERNLQVRSDEFKSRVMQHHEYTKITPGGGTSGSSLNAHIGLSIATTRIIQIQPKHLYYSASVQKKTVDHEPPLPDLDLPDDAPIEEKSAEIKEQDEPITQSCIQKCAKGVLAQSTMKNYINRMVNRKREL